MSEQELINRITILKQQLDLITKYRDGFDKKYGNSVVQKMIDKTLDEFFLRKKQLKNIQNN